jgi:hypothetical protein
MNQIYSRQVDIVETAPPVGTLPVSGWRRIRVGLEHVHGTGPGMPAALGGCHDAS